LRRVTVCSLEPLSSRLIKTESCWQRLRENKASASGATRSWAVRLFKLNSVSLSTELNGEGLVVVVIMVLVVG